MISPKYIHQIFINEDDTMPDFPLAIQENIRSVQVWYPEADYKLWCRSELEILISENFEPAVLQAFQSLKSFAYKADLARYCLAYLFGGLYIDVGIRLFQPIDVPETCGFIGFRDLLNGNSMWNAVYNGIFWARTSHRLELIEAINQIVKNVQTEFYGENPLYPTGPVLFGKSIAKVMTDTDCYRHDEFWIGEVRYIIGADVIYFLTPTSQVVGMRLKSISHGDMSRQLKANSYNELWKDKKVYENVVHWQWSYLDEKIYCDNQITIGTKTAQAIEWHKKGMICFGPYISLEAGQYQLKIQLNDLESKGIEVEITANNGGILISRTYKKSNTKQSITVAFTLEDDLNQIEFRLYSTTNTSGRLLGYELQKKTVENESRNEIL